MWNWSELLCCIPTHFILACAYAGILQVTILTPYTGQVFLIRRLLRQRPVLQDVRLCPIDNYQGEENDIVLLSLVRSCSSSHELHKPSIGLTISQSIKTLVEIYRLFCWYTLQAICAAIQSNCQLRCVAWNSVHYEVAESVMGCVYGSWFTHIWLPLHCILDNVVSSQGIAAVDSFR